MGFRSGLCACLAACLGIAAWAGGAPLVERTADELILHVNEAVDQGGDDVYLSYNFSDDVMDFHEAAMAVNRDHFGTGTAGSADIASDVIFPPGVSYRDETDAPRIGWSRVVNAANRSLAGCVASNDYYVVERVRAPQSSKYGELTLKLNDRARPAAESIGLEAGLDGVVVRPGNVKPFLWYVLGWSASPDGPFAYDAWRQADAEGGLPPFIAPRSGSCGFYRLSVSTKNGGD